MNSDRKRIYCGVGSRRTPEDIILYFEKVGKRLNELGYVLRSGGAKGADSAFEKFAWPKAEVFVATPSSKYIYIETDNSHPAHQLASSVHPAWNLCSDFVKKLHSRNAFQVLGKNLDSPADFLLCWTPCGAEKENECNINTGGTATAIRIADRNKIPIFNFKNENRILDFRNYMLDLPPW